MSARLRNAVPLIALVVAAGTTKPVVDSALGLSASPLSMLGLSYGICWALFLALAGISLRCPRRSADRYAVFCLTLGAQGLVLSTAAANQQALVVPVLWLNSALLSNGIVRAMRTTGGAK